MACVCGGVTARCVARGEPSCTISGSSRSEHPGSDSGMAAVGLSMRDSGMQPWCSDACGSCMGACAQRAGALPCAAAPAAMGDAAARPAASRHCVSQSERGECSMRASLRRHRSRESGLPGCRAAEGERQPLRGASTGARVALRLPRKGRRPSAMLHLPQLRSLHAADALATVWVKGASVLRRALQ